MADWLRRIFSTDEGESTRRRPSGPMTSCLAAVSNVEVRICDVLVTSTMTPSCALLDTEVGAGDDGLTVRRVEASAGAAGCVATAVGLALSGQRVSAFVDARDLASIAPPLAIAARRQTPLVVHVSFEGHPDEGGHGDLMAVAESGALVTLAADPQEAADLTVAARLAAETTLLPVVVAAYGQAHAPVALPGKDSLAALVGRAADEIDSPTPAQIEIFGQRRRRVPAWFDATRPMALGMPAQPADAGMMAAGRSAFAADVARQVRETLDRSTRIINGPVQLLRRYRLEDAEVVFVAQGAPVATAETTASRLRDEGGARVGVVGVTWLSPFPKEDLAAALKGRRGVVVVEHTRPSTGEEPPLLVRVRTALEGSEATVVSAVSAGAPIEAEGLEACFRMVVQETDRGRRGSPDPVPRHVRLDIRSGLPPSGLPRRDGLEARVRAAYPEMAAGLAGTAGAGEHPADQAASDRRPPALLARIPASRTAPDSLPRAWGEILEPRLAGPWPRLPDPLMASGAMPALAAALSRTPPTAPLAQIADDDCTGCGACWTACPESAIGVTVTGLQALLDTASRLAGTRGEVAEAVRRSHRHVATAVSRVVDGEVRGVLPASALAQAWHTVSPRMVPEGDDRSAHDAVFDATRVEATRLSPIITDRFFHARSDESKAAEVLVIAVDPLACNGCGLCVQACPEAAVTLCERPADGAALQARWSAWEALPDTTGATCARAAEDPEIGALGAMLLSRHCNQALVGGNSEPGSGERLALRLVAAVAEHHGQRHGAALARELGDLAQALTASLRDRLSAGLSAAQVDTVAEALAAQPVADVGDLVAGLGRLGTRMGIDRRGLIVLTSLVQRLTAWRHALVQGADGLGRARFAVAVAGTALAERLVPYPHHPLFAPLATTGSVAGPAFALGLAEGLAKAHLDLFRDLRRAAVELEAPVDRPARLAAIDRLTYQDLEARERAACIPLLLVVDDAFLADHGPGVLSHLLSVDLPVKILLLDGLSVGRHPDPALVAIAHQNPFVLASSLAYPEHLAGGLEAALGHPGPALVHLHTPVPSRHGFAPDAALSRARKAVEAGAHILLRYDPTAEGHLGLRLSLAGNPETVADGHPVSLSEWAAGESRFGVAGAGLSPGAADACRRRWQTLRELAGEGGQLVDRIEADVRARLSADHRAALDHQAAEYEARIAQAVAEATATAQERVTERLLDLSVARLERF